MFRPRFPAVMTAISGLRLPQIFSYTAPPAASCSEDDLAVDVVQPTADVQDDEAFHTPLAIPRELADPPEELIPFNGCVWQDSDSEDDTPSISLRELIEDAAGEAIRENNVVLERDLNVKLDARFDTLRPLFEKYTHKFLGDMQGGIDVTFERIQEMMDRATDKVDKVAQGVHSEFFSKEQAQNLKTRLRNEINNETLRSKNDNATLHAAFDSVLERVTSVEKAQTKLQTQLIEATEQRAKDATTISDLKAELGRTLASIATMNIAASRRESMLNTMKLDIGEAVRRAEKAERKANILDEHVKRWLNEELSKKREAEAVERKKREAEEKRKRAEEAVRLEEERKKRAAEEAERKRQEAENARLREEARKADEEARRAAADRSRREAQEEKERARQARTQEEKEKQESAQREKLRQERKRGNHNILDRWALYEAPLAENLTFDTLVWPVLIPPVDDTDLTLGAIWEFLFSDMHSEDKDDKQRLREAFLRWHEDKRVNVRSRVPEGERTRIDKAFHTISVHLNDIKAWLRSRSEDNAA